MSFMGSWEHAGINRVGYETNVYIRDNVYLL